MDKILKTATTSDFMMICLFAVVLIVFMAFVIYSSIPEETSTGRRYVRRRVKEGSVFIKQYDGSSVTRIDVSIGKFSKSYYLAEDFRRLPKNRQEQIKERIFKEFKNTVIDVIETAETAKWLEGAK